MKQYYSTTLVRLVLLLGLVIAVGLTADSFMAAIHCLIGILMALIAWFPALFQRRLDYEEWLGQVLCKLRENQKLVLVVNDDEIQFAERAGREGHLVKYLGQPNIYGLPEETPDDSRPN